MENNPSILKRVYFVRHGESEANMRKLYNAPDTPLSERGREQASFIAERAKKLRFDALLSSPLPRARATAEAISAKTGMEIRFDPVFEETRMPSQFFEKDLYSPDVRAGVEAYWAHAADSSWRYFDGENASERITRAQKAVQTLVGAPEKNLLVVTHGTFLKFMILAMMTPKQEEILALARPLHHFLSTTNTGLTLVERIDQENPRWILKVWNDQVHLGE